MSSIRPTVRLVMPSGQQGLQCASWGVALTPFGQSVAVWTDAGLLALWLATDDPEPAMSFVQARHAQAMGSGDSVLTTIRDDGSARVWCDRVFGVPPERACPHATQPLDVVVSGTEFELTVWRALCEIPRGMVVTYSELASAIGRPKAARAVGSAIGRNGVAVLIPCHRVVPGSGGVGQFRWGASVKRALIDWEAA